MSKERRAKKLNQRLETSHENKFNRTPIYADNRRNKKDAMRIALSAKQLSVYIRVQKGISYTIKLPGHLEGC